MRRLFYQTKLYDYSSVKEAEKHIKDMESKGWRVKHEDDRADIYTNGQDEYPYSVEYYKEL